MQVGQIEGFDISSVQGHVDFASLGQYRFVYIKAKQGNDGVDPLFHQNCLAAKTAGIVYGAYHFVYPLGHIDPVQQAQDFYNASGGLGSNIGDLPQAVDLEWPAPQDWAHWGCTAASICTWCSKLLAKMDELHGCETVVYIYPDFVNHLVSGGGDISFLRTRKRLWMAGGKHYGDGVLPGPGEPPPEPQGLTNIVLQQWDGNGGRRLPNGVDCDFDLFLGSEADFALFRGIKPDPVQDGMPVTNLNETIDVG